MPHLLIRPYTSAVALDGSSSFLTKASPSGINYGTNPLTFAAFVTLRSNSLMCLFQMKKAGLNQSPGFLIGQLAGTYYFGFDTSNAGNNLTITKAQFDAAITVGTPVRLAYVMTTSSLSLYANGSLVKTQSWGVAINSPAPDSILMGKGVDNGGTNVYFANAILNDANAYNAALSGSEVSNEYYSNIRPSSLASSWLMGEGSGSSVADGTGSNTLTGTSIAWSTAVPTRARTIASARTLASPRDIASPRTAIS